MAMGTRRKRERQEQLWVATATLARPASHPFYERLNRLLDESGFDEFVEPLCQPFYAKVMGRPGLAPGIYFRALLVGYFEGIDSERGIGWRAADSLGIRAFLRIALDEAAPDHSTLSRTRRLIDLETHKTVFAWVLAVLAGHGLLRGKTLGIDATTLEANAALRSIVRRDSGEAYEDFLKRLAQESGIATPTRAQLAKLDRKRRKKGSNQEWVNPHEADGRITKMKDGSTHLAHKAEHAVDMETGAVVAVTLQPANAGDTSTVHATLVEALENVETVAEALEPASGTEGVQPDGPVELVTDKGYHSKAVVRDLSDAGVRTYVSEPERGGQKWPGQKAEQMAVYGNRRRNRGERGKALQRCRSEVLERVNAHLYETGRMRRTHLRGHPNILKRLLIHVCGLNLGLLLRAVCGVGTPRGLQGRAKMTGLDFQMAYLRLLCVFWEMNRRNYSDMGRTGNLSRCGNVFSSPLILPARCCRR
ncbi:MAG: transposase [Acidobacteria bacterium]|nr:transposase [Acidobacteriota bacterium]